MSYDAQPQTLDPQAQTGRVFAASTDLIAMTSLGRVRLAITNPTNSGRLVHIIALASSNASTVPGSIKVWHMPTAGVPTTVAPIPAKNCYLKLSGDTTLPAPKAIVYADQGTNYATLTVATAALPAMSGGSQLPTLAMPSQSREVYNLSPVLLDPGVTLGFDANLGVVSATSNSVMSLYWWEQG